MLECLEAFKHLLCLNACKHSSIYIKLIQTLGNSVEQFFRGTSIQVYSERQAQCLSATAHVRSGKILSLTITLVSVMQSTHTV